MTKPLPYKVWMRSEVHGVRKRLPGQIRQRVKQTLSDLGREPRPSQSRALRLPETGEPVIEAGWELRRIRLEDWRIVYAIDESWREVAVLTIQRRPPYDYDDLEALLSELR
jgi:mRNA interferase RelE/StbE